MKTIIENATSESLYIFDDGKIINILDSKMTVGEPVELMILDCNSTNVSLVENVNPPEDWEGRKYTFDGTTWTVTQEWIDANTEEVSQDKVIAPE